ATLMAVGTLPEPPVSSEPPWLPRRIRSWLLAVLILGYVTLVVVAEVTHDPWLIRIVEPDSHVNVVGSVVLRGSYGSDDDGRHCRGEQASGGGLPRAAVTR